MESALKESARKYFNLGFNIVLLKEKRPLHEWKQWQEKRQTQEEFESLPWSRAEQYAVVCGVSNDEGLHFCAVDYDVKGTSQEAQEKGKQVLKRLRITRIEETPSGGQHWCYLSRKKPKSISAYHDEAALELLGEGKLCVMAPSKGYKSLNDNPPTIVDDLEDDFIKALRAVGVKASKSGESEFWFDLDLAGKKYTGKAPPCIIEISKGTAEGQRNEFGIRYASYLANFRKLKPRTVKRLMKAWNENNSPPLDEKELESIIKSAYSGRYIYGCRDPILRKFCLREECPIAPKIITKLLTDEEIERANKLLEDPKLLDYVVKFGRRFLIGEDRAILTNFVEICSGQTKYPISGIIEGFSGSGKNQSIRAIKPLIPKEWIFEFTTSTPEAIKYIPEDFSGTLIIYEVAGIQSKTGTLGLRAIGEGESIETIYPMRDEETGKMMLGRARTNARNFITTESDVDVHPDLYRRVLRLSMNHSTLLTKRVLAKKLRDAQFPEKIQKILNNDFSLIPYSEEDFQNALRLNNWQAEVILFPPYQLMKLVDLTVTKEQQVALRTHIEKILNFMRVLALIHQKQRIRLEIDGETYVIASPEDFYRAIEILYPTIWRTVTRLGRRQQEVLELFESYSVLTKHEVAEKLKVSTVTAARALKSLAKAGYLKENTRTKPYEYERLQENPKQLVILQDTSEYWRFWLEAYRNFLKRILSTYHIRGIQVKVIGEEECLKRIAEKQYIPQKRQVDKVPSTPELTSFIENKQKSLVSIEMTRENSLISLKEIKTVYWVETAFDRHPCCVCGYEKLTCWKAETFDRRERWICEDCKEEWEKMRKVR